MPEVNNLLVYFILSVLLMYIGTKISLKLNLLDIPIKRKIHKQPTPYTGGLILSFTYLFALKIFNVEQSHLNIILSSGLLMAIVGFLDDRYKLNVGGKLGLQIIPIFYLIVFEKISLTHLGEYNIFKLSLNSFSVTFTLLCVLFLINAFNYIDGIDGSLGFTTISVVLILYFLTIEKNYFTYLISLLLPLGIFLIFNFSLFNVSKLFLGDSGSLLLGFIISFTLIHLAKNNVAHPILLAWSVSIFVYEFISVNLDRLKNKKKIFEAGQDHIHHLILKKIRSTFYTSCLMSFLNIFMFICGYLTFKYINSLSSLILFVTLFFIFNFLRKKILTKT